MSKAAQKTPKFSENVQQLRFMQVASNASKKKSYKLEQESEWILSDEAKEILKSHLIPPPKTGFSVDVQSTDIKLTVNHRRSFQGFNPVVEKFEKIIKSRANKLVKHDEEIVEAEKLHAFTTKKSQRGQ